MTQPDFTVPSFAAIMGVTPVTVWRQIAKEKVKAYKIGRSTRIAFTELERIRSSNQIQPKHS